MDNKKLLDKYNVMEEQLKDDARSIKFIKNLGKQLIEKIKIIDKEIKSINPDRKQLKYLTDLEKSKILALHQLREIYNSQFNMITVILNKSDNIINDWKLRLLKEKGLDDKFFIDIEE